MFSEAIDDIRAVASCMDRAIARKYKHSYNERSYSDIYADFFEAHIAVVSIDVTIQSQDVFDVSWELILFCEFVKHSFPSVLDWRPANVTEQHFQSCFSYTFKTGNIRVLAGVGIRICCVAAYQYLVHLAQY